MDDPKRSEAEELATLSDEDMSIASQLARVATAMMALTQQLEQSGPKISTIERRSFWQVISSLIGGVIAVLLLLSLGGVYQVVTTVKDCIEPTGQCYRDQRSRTGEVEARIMKAQADAANRTLVAVCAVFEEHQLAKPPECPSA